MNDVKKITLEDLRKTKDTWNHAVIVFDNKSWEKDFSLDSRSYKISSDCKYFDHTKIGTSLYGSALDGTDNNVRLERYLGNWIIEYCYIVD